ncbi:MAG: MATE family efflux transporter [Tepidisphaeraceae bacterium]
MLVVISLWVYGATPSTGTSIGLLALIAMGWIARSVSDIRGGWLQHGGRLALDNSLVIIAEVVWVLTVLVFVGAEQLRGAGRIDQSIIVRIGLAYLLSGALLIAMRATALLRVEARRSPAPIDPTIPRDAAKLVRAGCTITLGSLADYLYGPVSMLIVTAALGSASSAGYGVALFFDSVLLLLVAGVAGPMLPRIAAASSAHDFTRVRKLYVNATLACLGVLASAAIVVWIASPWILTVWLKNPPDTVHTVLPIVLIHTVLGGTAGVGRAALIGIGRHRAYAVSALVGGLMNVALAFVAVYILKLGLPGVAWATVIAVGLRCAAWMPWFVMRATRSVSR